MSKNEKASVARVVPRVLGASAVTLVGGVVFVGGQPAQAAAFTVDNNNTSGDGSLYQAILNANAAGGADTITITATGVIDVRGLPAITGSVTIDGPGSASLTLNGYETECDLFYVNTPSVDLSISGVTITEVYCDAIDMDSEGGSLTLDDVTVTFTYSSMIEANDLATVTITNSYFNDTYEGYGIYVKNVTGSVTISNTTIKNTDENEENVQYAFFWSRR